MSTPTRIQPEYVKTAGALEFCGGISRAFFERKLKEDPFAPRPLWCGSVRLFRISDLRDFLEGRDREAE